MDIQKQKGGDNSQNIQVNGNVTIGISYDEARQIALDVFNANCQTMMSEAVQIADTRKNEIVDELIKRLYDEHPELSIRLKDPSIQYSLFSVIKNYVRTGDPDLEEQLLRMLILRMESKDRSLEQIVLDEAIEIVPKLTQDQINILSLVTSAIYINHHDINNLSKLNDFINCQLMIFYPTKRSESSYTHLQYTGCCTFLPEGATYKPFTVLLGNRYSGLLNKGFNQEMLEQAFPEDHEKLLPLLTRCQHNQNLLQFNAINESVLKREIERLNLNDLSDKILQLHNQHQMNDDEIKSYLISINPEINNFLNQWSGEFSRLKSIALTPVGFAIALLNYNIQTKSNLRLGVFI